MSIIEFETPTVNEKGEVIARTNHSAEQFTEELGNGIPLDMILIPAGAYQMGSRPSDGNTDEQPQHFVTIKAFMLGKSLIMQGHWKAIMGKLPRCRFKGEELPIERVSWDRVQEFCRRLSEKAGRHYRLPSETQWEYACRAGTLTPFSFGETLTTELANFNGEHTFRNAPQGVYRHTTTAGGTFPPNAFGIHDMHGNLWEWCADSWINDYRMSLRDGSAYQMMDNPDHVARGGSWHEPPRLCRSAARLRVLHSDAEDYIGFRVVCDVV